MAIGSIDSGSQLAYSQAIQPPKPEAAEAPANGREIRPDGDRDDRGPPPPPPQISQTTTNAQGQTLGTLLNTTA